MKVADFMHKPLITVQPTDPVRTVVKAIFNIRVGGVPVVKNKKLLGIVTESDILSKLFPSVEDFMEDFAHSSDFESMESKFDELLSQPVSAIMNKSVKSVKPPTPLLRAQSTMLIHEIGRLPVVNDDGELVGIISHGDIFRALVGSEIPYDDTEEFRDWLAHHYDFVERWEWRLTPEISSLEALFKKRSVKNIADVICGTGEHAINFAKKDYLVSAFDDSLRMLKIAKGKTKELSETVLKNLHFIEGGYLETLKQNTNFFDAVIIMGNGLPYESNDWKKILKLAYDSTRTDGVIVIQLANFKKVLELQQGQAEFRIAPSAISPKQQYSFLFFYQPVPENKKMLLSTMSILSFDGRRWIHASLSSTPIARLEKADIVGQLKKTGFKNITTFGSDLTQPMFRNQFDANRHHWLNVVAKK